MGSSESSAACLADLANLLGSRFFCVGKRLVTCRLSPSGDNVFAGGRLPGPRQIAAIPSWNDWLFRSGSGFGEGWHGGFFAYGC